MPEQHPCQRLARVSGSESDWTFHSVKSKAYHGTTAPFGTSTFDFYYYRTFSESYRCSCNGRSAEVVVENNLEIGIIDDPENRPYVAGSFPVPLPPVGSPLFRVLRALNDRIFGSGISLALGPVDAERPLITQRANELKDTLTPTPAGVIRRPTPVALCGQEIHFDTDDVRPWPGAADPPPAPAPGDEDLDWLMEQLSRMIEATALIRRRKSRLEEMEEEGADPAEIRRQHAQLESLKERLRELLEILRQGFQQRGM